MDPKTTVQMTLLYDMKTGAFRMSAPMNNQVLCLGILAMAQKAILDHDPSKKLVGAKEIPADAPPPPAPKDGVPA